MIFIDDLDRCQPETAHRLLDALKIHLSIPNCVFVLGMNQQIVVEAIAVAIKKDEAESLTRLKADAYLEKLCTNIWRLPLPGKPEAFFCDLILDATLKSELIPVLQATRCLPPNPRRLKALANVTNRLWQGANAAIADKRRAALAVLTVAYIYQFHGDLYRRWQYDADFWSEIKRFVNDPLHLSRKVEEQGLSFRGLTLPRIMSDDPQSPTSDKKAASAFPDPTAAGVFWIAPLIQEKAPFGDAFPIDFSVVLNAGV